jgi:epoxyqueuosine reductase
MVSINFDHLKNAIKTEVNDLGFSHIGYCSPQIPYGFDTYLHWLDKGHSADLEYLQREDAIEKRRDPRKILESVETIIVLAIPYYPSNPPEADLLNPRIASYALGEDYHIVIPILLKKFIQWLESNIDNELLEYKVYTDTGPILERSLATMAGIGWIGKNSCLIIPGQGSYFFLAEILINLHFSPDQQLNIDYCGNCHRCIDSCPTRCIQDNRTIDTAKCLSYLTIENKKEIPENLRELTGNWVFGCDVCQQVCPWNTQFAKLPKHAFFQPNEQISSLRFDQINNLTEPLFNQIVANSPIKRAKFKGFKRNMINAIGNSGNPEYLSILEMLRKTETDFTLTNQLQWAIRRLGNQNE